MVDENHVEKNEEVKVTSRKLDKGWWEVTAGDVTKVFVISEGKVFGESDILTETLASLEFKQKYVYPEIYRICNVINKEKIYGID